MVAVAAARLTGSETVVVAAVVKSTGSEMAVVVAAVKSTGSETVVVAAAVKLTGSETVVEAAAVKSTGSETAGAAGAVRSTGSEIRASPFSDTWPHGKNWSLIGVHVRASFFTLPHRCPIRFLALESLRLSNGDLRDFNCFSIASIIIPPAVLWGSSIVSFFCKLYPTCFRFKMNLFETMAHTWSRCLFFTFFAPRPLSATAGYCFAFILECSVHRVPMCFSLPGVVLGHDTSLSLPVLRRDTMSRGSRPLCRQARDTLLLLRLVLALILCI